MAQLIPFVGSSAHKDEDVYEMVTDQFHTLKRQKIIEDWVGINDLYIDTDGDVYAVEHYKETLYAGKEYGHNVLRESEPDMRGLVLVVTYTELMKKLHPILRSTTYAH